MKYLAPLLLLAACATKPDVLIVTGTTVIVTQGSSVESGATLEPGRTYTWEEIEDMLGGSSREF